MGKEKQSTPSGSKLVEEVLIDELVRIANIEEMVEGKQTQVSFFCITDEKCKKKMYELLRGSGYHYRSLIGAVDGLESLKEKYKERFLSTPPFKIDGETERESIENQLSAESGMLVVYESILEMLEKFEPKAEIRRLGVRIVPDELKPTIIHLIKSEKEHVATVEAIFRLFRETNLHLFGQ